jgi:amino acid adenylation domain-containing protein
VPDQVSTGEFPKSPAAPDGACEQQLVAVFEAQVDRAPDQVAVEFGEQQLTYGELDVAANRQARLLARHGLEPQACVGVAMTRSLESLVAYLGVLKAGGVYVPLDPCDPPARLEFILRDTGARLLLVSDGAAPSLGAADPAVIALDPGLGVLAAEDPTRPSTRVAPGDLAYVMYTSGSTGRPKGVAIEHRNVVERAAGAAPFMPGPGDGMLQVSELDFDAQTWEVWGAWTVGARLVVAPPGTPEPATIADLLETRDGPGAAALLSPGLFRQMVEARLPAFGALRLLLVGGDVLSPVHARRFVEAHPGVPLVNLYGPTEVTVCCSAYPVGLLPADQAVPVGRALGNTQLYVLDDDGSPVDAGQPGELYIGGGCVARGYLNLPGPTAARFVPDPFGADPDGRLYRTGDRVCVRPDGELEFLGRLDDQVKIHGFRIEPGEIEAELRAVPGVQDAVVVAREDLPGHRRLVAYLVPDGDAGDDLVPDARAAVSRQLPAHMVPSAFVTIRDLPHTARGKLDRAALPAPAAVRASGADPQPPSTPLEQALTTIWSAVLQVPDLGVDEDFVGLGGDSLLAVRVTVQARERLGVELPVDAVFTQGTVARLASWIEATGAGDLEPGPPLRHQARRPRRPFPVTPTQAQACFATQVAEDALPYQFQALVHFDGDLDVSALEQVLTEIVARHEILHTRFVERRGRWWQILDAPFRVRLPIRDVRSADDPDQALHEITERAFAERIPIDTLPLMRWKLVQTGEHHFVLVHVEHHLIHDGWSWGVFLQELATLYGAAVEDQPSPLRALPIQFRDFAEWQRRLVDSPLGSRQLEYWTQRLALLPPPLAMPADRPRPTRPSYRGGQLVVELPGELTGQLRALSSEHGQTLFMTMLGAFYALLSRYSGAEDLVVGSGVANRSVRDTEGLIGMMLNTVALRVDLSGDPSVTELLGRVRDATLAAYANQDVPFEHVLRAVAPQRRPGALPIYQVLFSFQDPPSPDLDVPGVTILPDDTSGNDSAKADLNVVVINRRGGDPGLTVVWEYSADLFDPDTARALLDSYQTVLVDFVRDSAQRLTELPLLGPTQRQQLLADSGRAVSYERDTSIVDLFEARVRETPGAVAVVSHGVELTYQELDERAGRLAVRLAGLGAGLGAPVAMLMERSVEAVIALVAILKTGSAYVALDPSFPTTRIGWLIEDAHAVAVCTTGRYSDRLFPDHAAVLLVDEMDLERGATYQRDTTIAATDMAYVAYTSGTSGTPKGVAVPHRAVVRLVRSTDYVSLGPDETLVTLAPLAFDASTFEIWGALANGGRVAVPPPGVLAPIEIAEVIERFGVTTMFLTTALFHQLVDRSPTALGRLRQLITGGDVLSPEHVAHAVSLLAPGGVLVAAYGPTEATTFTTCHRMTAGDVVPRPVPIGTPIPNTWVYIVDEHSELVPSGVAGELWIGGDGVANGYLGQPALTAERFLPDPFSDDPSGRVYRSGDRARRRADGVIEFLGRIDRQVKIRGFRVEPAAVERALLEHPAVAEAVVVPRMFGPDDRRLIAYVTPRGAEVPVDAVKAFLSARIPAYELPIGWVRLAELPLTPNGKVDTDALPEPEFITSDHTTAPAPASPLERRLVEIWEDVLNVRPISIQDDFFELGGHSLIAVELFTAIERVTGVRLPLASIFEAPTVSQLAALVHANGWDAPWQSLVPLRETGSRPPLFFITAGDGNPVGFGALARRLGTEQPFYSLQPSGLDGRTLLDLRVDRMARRYLEEVRSVQPEGPYLLGGRCFGTLIAFELTRLLEASGQRVALVIALDSVGPMWSPRVLANGLPFDEVMNLARVSEPDAAAAGDIFEQADAADRFVAWLREPVSVDGPWVVNRYLHAAYLARPDLRAGYPLSAGGHQGLVHWGWVGGRSEMGMNPALLASPSPAALRAAPSVDPRVQTAWARFWARAVDWIDVLTRGRIPALTRRRQPRLLDLAGQMVLSYRAGPCIAPVVLIRSEEYRDDATLARWYGIRTGGVEEEYADGTHQSMMREPDVASLARCVARHADAALQNPLADVPLVAS